MFNIWKQFQDTRSVGRNPGQGCPRDTTSREDLHLSIIPRRNRDARVSQLSRRLYATVSRRLHERGLFPRKLVLCPFSSAKRESPFKMKRRS
ncbi:HTH_Tnp_Tc3_2 domain-containing protein [Trichonephila clavipes]|nr:HTH_Tnp_Tc3_2 domain-containing protein [Trichonephila clavipes]